LKANYSNGVKSGEYIVFYKNGNIEFKANYDKDTLSGKHLSYHRNGAFNQERTYYKGKVIGDLISYDDKSMFNSYLRLNHEGESTYKLVVDSLRNHISESGHKFVYVAINDNLEKFKYKDSLKLELEIANPPSCKKVLYTRLNGVTKDSLEISGIEYNYAVLPKDLGNNKLELFIDYYCTGYKLKSDYFTLNFNVKD
tara:strand:+ start:1520 stop:2110 length:591 start_codon:yes stop_codon:yes gene_type:complete